MLFNIRHFSKVNLLKDESCTWNHEPLEDDESFTILATSCDDNCDFLHQRQFCVSGHKLQLHYNKALELCVFYKGGRRIMRFFCPAPCAHNPEPLRGHGRVRGEGGGAARVQPELLSAAIV